MEPRKISVITVSLNQGEFIRDNIESVLAQDYQNFEHIIVDGGSRDDTLEILRSYPHLSWTSEPDHGQSHALNKGFARARGDYIVWLNSDDYLAPGVFPEIAAALEIAPVIFTPAGKTDRHGSLEEPIENVERSWFDLLKYWTPYAWVAQTGVFFRRELLEAVKFSDGAYLDESLNFCMDYDLWMRFAAQVQISHPIKRICSYFRIYDQNKTGVDGAATQRECSRVYRRYAAQASRPEWHFSVVLPVSSFAQQELSETLVSINDQSLYDVEVIIVNRGRAEESAPLHDITKQFNNAAQQHSYRFVSAPESSLLAGINAGVQACRGRYVTCVFPGDELEHDYLRHMHNLFGVDALGLILPLSHASSDFRSLTQNDNQLLYSPLQVFSHEIVEPRFAAKKEVFHELGGNGRDVIL